MAPIVHLGVQEVYVMEEHFHCDGPEQEQADKQVGVPKQEQTDRQVGGHYHQDGELEQGPHSFPPASTVPVVLS